MKHAGPAALDALLDLVVVLRALPGLKEPRPSIFYRKGKAWLHFHEDAAGLFADLRAGPDWERFRVSEPEERARFLAVVRGSL